MKNDLIKKHRALIVALFLFTFIGIIFNMIYVIVGLWQRLEIKPEIFTGFIISGSYLGIFSFSFIQIRQYFKKMNKWFTLKSGLIVGLIIFSFFGLYCNGIYCLISYSLGIQIQFLIILIFLMFGTYFGIYSIFLVKYGYHLRKKGDKLSFKGNLMIFFFIFLFFAICYNIISLICYMQVLFIPLNCLGGILIGSITVGVFNSEWDWDDIDFPPF